MIAVFAISVEDGRECMSSFFATVSQCFQDHTSKLLRIGGARGGNYLRFCFP